MHGPRNRKTTADFIEDVIDYWKQAQGRKVSDAEVAKKLQISAATLSRWRAGAHGITIENLEQLTKKLLGVEFVQCLYFPHEVSELRAIEVETLNRLGVKRPGSQAGAG
jgi:transcriptional regulator with XRE-family HTH domain